MSALLFGRSSAPARVLRVRVALLGLVGGLALLLAAGLLGASYVGLLTTDVRATADLSTTGEMLAANSPVKYHGLRVGRVIAIRTGPHPSASIVLGRQYAAHIPRDVRARVLPSTLFGAEYVDLVPRGAGQLGVGSGVVIPADRSAPTLRLMDLLARTQRVLVAIRPSRLQEAIHQIAAALDGRGAALGELAARTSRLLSAWTRHRPDVAADIRLLATDTRRLAVAEPDLLAALHDSLPLAAAIVREQQSVRHVISSGSTLIGDLTPFMRTQGGRITSLLHGLAATLATYAAYAGPFSGAIATAVRVLANGAATVHHGAVRMDAAFGTAPVGPYGRGQCIRYGSLHGSNC